MKLTWKSKFTFGKYKDTDTNLLQALVTDKPWLAWCYREKLDEKYEELKFIRENVKQYEWNNIIKAG